MHHDAPASQWHKEKRRAPSGVGHRSAPPTPSGIAVLKECFIPVRSCRGARDTGPVMIYTYVEVGDGVPAMAIFKDNTDIMATEHREEEFIGFDAAQIPPLESYRILLNCVAPRPIAFVSTLSAEGAPNLAPFSFFMREAAIRPPWLSLRT